MKYPVWLNDSLSFPETTQALDDPNGLLAIGGDLSPERLLAAYRRGIFPWYSEGQPILWWSPSPRMVLQPSQLHIGRSTRKLCNRKAFAIRVDTAFAQVVDHCSSIERPQQDGSWITEEMASAYRKLHQLGFAHSVEAWRDGELVGGLYGVAIGRAFFGESMFSLVSGASKVCFVHLAKQLQSWEYSVVDCQIHTDYLQSFGAAEIPRREFEGMLGDAVVAEGPKNWQLAWTQTQQG